MNHLILRQLTFAKKKFLLVSLILNQDETMDCRFDKLQMMTIVITLKTEALQSIKKQDRFSSYNFATDCRAYSELSFAFSVLELLA